MHLWMQNASCFFFEFTVIESQNICLAQGWNNRFIKIVKLLLFYWKATTLLCIAECMSFMLCECPAL